MAKWWSHQLAGLLIAAALAFAPGAHADVELPSIGDPVNQVLSPEAEAAIGARMMARAQRHLDLNRDPEIAAYLDGLGGRLARVIDDPPFERMTFFLVYSDGINAFAAPGGYIGINSGLFRAAENEAQLAGVLAHEIAHVTQRHLAKAFAANQRNQYKTLAAVLAGILLAGENPQAAQAAIATGQASEAQRRINYTRSNEYEADRIGIQTLARAGFDPAGMAGMFEILRGAGGGDATPEFLRTHPISTNRIAEAKSRAARIEAGERRRDSLVFHLIKRRIAVQRTDDPERLARQWRDEAPAATSYRALAHRYGLALLDLSRGASDRAIERLRALRDDAPDQRHYGLALARAHAQRGDIATALEVWRHFDALYPRSLPVTAVGADLLTADGRTGEAVAHLTQYVRDHPDPPAIAWRRLAQAADADGRSVRSHEALGEYYARTGRLDESARQLELALDGAAEDSSDAKRIQARLDQVRALQQRQMARIP